MGGGNGFIGDANDGDVVTTLALEIGELTADGILVDDEGPAPENAVPQPPAQGQVGEWEKQLICIRRNNTAITDTVGKWKEKSWKQIGNMTEFAIFWMCFPEDYIKTILIPATNNHLPGESLTLNEFYVWLGCRFLWHVMLETLKHVHGGQKRRCHFGKEPHIDCGILLNWIGSRQFRGRCN